MERGGEGGAGEERGVADFGLRMEWGRSGGEVDVGRWSDGEMESVRDRESERWRDGGRGDGGEGEARGVADLGLRIGWSGEDVCCRLDCCGLGERQI